MRPFFVSGIGTGIGKTVVSALLCETLQADYWKPVQAGFAEGTDSETVRSLVTNPQTFIHPETYRLQLPASPHIAAREENTRIEFSRIKKHFASMNTGRPLIIEGAGGLLVPLNESEMIADLVSLLDARLILVSRNYLGSINHSLLTAEVCRQRQLEVSGWVFNDQFMDYEGEIVSWTGIPAICSVPFMPRQTREGISMEAKRIGDRVRNRLLPATDHPRE
ncbi:MAG TPA: dethiobiotin synthase [Puia sp.]|jgi:dethiobiotin synthetase